MASTLRIDTDHLDAALAERVIDEDTWSTLMDLDGTDATDRQIRLFNAAESTYGEQAMIQVDADGHAYHEADCITEPVAHAWVEIDEPTGAEILAAL